MIKSSSNPGEDEDNGFTRKLDNNLLEEAALQEALAPPMSSDDATGAPPPGVVGREAWKTIALCIKHERAFPQWVMDYLKETAKKMVSITTNENYPDRQDIAHAVNFGPDNKRVDFDKDPETVYSRIQQWVDDGEVKSMNAGVGKYITEVLKDPRFKDETVRHWIKEGRKAVEGQTPDFGNDYDQEPIGDQHD